MVRNVSKPTYFRNDHVLNSKLVSETCEQFCICYKLYPKHDQNFIEHNFRHCKHYIRVSCSRILVYIMIFFIPPGVLITVSCIVFASLKNTLRARHMPSSTTELSWSFALSLLGGLGSIATSFLVCFG